jgi:WD40 repeat protein
LLINSFCQDYVVAGYEDGTIALCSTTSPTPLNKWHMNGTITSISWSPNRPAVFFVLISGIVYIWDLLENDNDPVLQLDMPDILKAKVLKMNKKAKLVTGDRYGKVIAYDLTNSLLDTWENELETCKELFNCLLI